MKRIFTIVSLIILGLLSVKAQNDTLVMWTFPSSDLSDTIADYYNNYNANSYIFTEGASAITMKNGLTTKSAQATEWQNGTGVKSWQIKINTSQHMNLMLNAKLTAGGSNPGPRDFKTQYKTSASGAWIDVANGEVTVANDWTTGVISMLLLPVECENQSELLLRFVMTSDTAQDGSIILPSGTSKIDDIVILGTVLSSVNSIEKTACNIYPNPSSGNFFIESDEEIESIDIYTMSGQLLYSDRPLEKSQQININIQPGIYFINLSNINNEKRIHKIIIR